MSMSGINVESDVVEGYEEMKRAKNVRYMQMSIKGQKVISIEKVDKTPVTESEENRKAVFEDFLAQLPTNDCRYIVYDFRHRTKDGEREKLIFIVWCPDLAPIKPKMLYAASKDALKKKLNGVGLEFQGSEIGDITYQEVVDKLLTKGN